MDIENKEDIAGLVRLLRFHAKNYESAAADVIENLMAYKEAAEKQEPVLRINTMGGGMQWNPNYRGEWCGEFYAKPVPADNQAVAVPDGWKLVPIDSTEEMRKAGENAINYNTSSQMVWKEMLSAAPSHSQQIDQGA